MAQTLKTGSLDPSGGALAKGSLWWWLLLLLGALVLDQLRVPLFLDCELSLAQSFVWLALLLFGWRHAVAISLALFVSVLVPWLPGNTHGFVTGPPHGALIGLLETVVVAALWRGRGVSRSLFVLVAGFWAFVAMPLHVISHGLSPFAASILPRSVDDFALSLALVEFVTALLCALLASALAAMLPWVRWFGLVQRTPPPSLADYFFNVLAIAVFAPALVLMIFSAHTARQEVVELSVADVRAAADDMTERVQGWLDRRLREFERFERVLDPATASPPFLRDTQELHFVMESVHAVFPEFRSLRLVEGSGQELMRVGGSPGLVVGHELKLMDLSLKNPSVFVTTLERQGDASSATDAELVFVKTVVPDSSWEGLPWFIIAELDLSGLEAALGKSSSRIGVAGGLVDDQGRLFLQTEGQKTAAASSPAWSLTSQELSAIFEARPSGTFVVPRWLNEKESSSDSLGPEGFTEGGAIAPLSSDAFKTRFAKIVQSNPLHLAQKQWTVLTFVDAQTRVAAAERFYVRSTEILLVLIFVGFASLKFAARRLSRSLLQLTRLTTEMTQDLTRAADVTPGASHFRETSLLQNNFLALAQALRARFDELISARAELEDRVATRTRLLRETNESLAAEIEERKRLEKDRERIIEILQASADFVAMVLPDGQVSWMNRFGYEILGLPLEHPVSSVSLAQFQPRWALDQLRAFALAAARRDGVWIGESSLIDGAGQTIPVSQMIIAHRDTAGDTRYYSMIMRDMRQFKQVQDDLQQAKIDAENANKAKTMFLANMSHEIRTPVAVIRGFVEILQQSKKMTTDQVHWLGVLKSASRQLEILIDDILDISKIERGMLRFESVEFKVSSLLSDVHTLMAPLAEQKGLRLRFVAEGHVPNLVRSDSHRIRQILLNLLGNALKFTSQGVVELKIGFKGKATKDDHEANSETRGHQASGFLSFTVSDTGVGIAPEHQSRIFQPFVQGDSSVTRKFGGTGLGLYLSRQLAERLGGQLVLVNSTTEGSTFEACIDAGNIHAAEFVSGQAIVLEALGSRVQSEIMGATSEGCRRTEPKLLTGLRVLVVEDSPDLRLLVGHVLKGSGARCWFACNGFEGVDEIRKQNFDVVLMDLQMPVMDGYTAVQTLRTEGFSVPVIALTAHAMIGEKERCLECGFSDYLTKPVELRVLVETVARCAGTALKLGRTTRSRSGGKGLGQNPYSKTCE